MRRGTWHDEHHETFSRGQRIADATARILGSWPFIIAQSGFVAAWVALNTIAFARRWDPYPFILLNLMFSIQAAYAGPVIMMSQNRQAERDRFQAQADYETNIKGEALAEEIVARLDRMEHDQLRRLLTAIDGDEQDPTQTEGGAGTVPPRA